MYLNILCHCDHVKSDGKLWEPNFLHTTVGYIHSSMLTVNFSISMVHCDIVKKDGKLWAPILSGANLR